ncbi:MAG: RHS repeat-associated core domain-containing protein [Acidobacteriia bacterium]|nr:RHS repeat-associated core domain-containing protein [Terriglobia bacterium]
MAVGFSASAKGRDIKSGGIGQPNLSIDAATNRIQTSPYVFDNAGNMTHDATAAYTFDGANRMTSANSGAATYTYFGPLRIKKAVGGVTTTYVYSGAKPIAEYVGTTISKEYIYVGGQLLATIVGSSITYHHPDHLSNRAETDATGNIVRFFGHFPYGETWYEPTGTDKDKFTSYERDLGAGETGLDYTMFRGYSSGLARFMSADLLGGHLGTPQSLNRYSYALNDPINLVDPTGLDGDHEDAHFTGSGCMYTTDGVLIECWGMDQEGNLSFQDWGDPGISSVSAPPSGGGIPADPCGGGPCGDSSNSGGGDVKGANKQIVCVDKNVLSWIEKAQLDAAETYAKLTGWTFGFGAGLDAAGGIGPGKLNFGVGGSASTVIVADQTGNSGILNSWSIGGAGFKGSSGSRWGAGGALGLTVLTSPNPIDDISGPSFSISAAGGAVLGAGGTITSSGAITGTFGLGAGAEVGIGGQIGPSIFIPFCKK